MNNLTRAYVLEPSLPSASARDGIFERGSGASGMGEGVGGERLEGREWKRECSSSKLVNKKKMFY